MLELFILYGSSLGISEDRVTQRYNAYCDYAYMTMQMEVFEDLECDLTEVTERIYKTRTGKY